MGRGGLRLEEKFLEGYGLVDWVEPEGSIIVEAEPKLGRIGRTGGFE